VAAITAGDAYNEVARGAEASLGKYKFEYRDAVRPVQS